MWPAPEITKTTAVPVQLYGRRAEKRLLCLTFSAIVEPINRVAEIAIGPAAGRPEWNALRNGYYANQAAQGTVRIIVRQISDLVDGHIVGERSCNDAD